MTGLCGWMTQQAGVPKAKKEIEQMLGSIKHRGPNRSGIFEGEHATLAATYFDRATLELRKLPMLSRDKRFIAILDGDFFNEAELIVYLRKLGSHIKRVNAEEILTELYRYKGLEGLNQAEGHFALALWDEQTSTLVLARDEFGVKPLFFRKQKERLLFASEAKAIIKVQSEPLRINLDQLHTFLNFQFLPGPTSLFDQIEQLEPGTAMLCTLTKISIHSLVNRKKRADLGLDEALNLSLTHKLEKSKRCMLPLDETPQSQLLAHKSLEFADGIRYAQFEGNYFSYDQDRINIQLLEMARSSFKRKTKKTFYSTLDVGLFEAMILNFELPLPGGILPFLQFHSYDSSSQICISSLGFSHLFMTDRVPLEVYRTLFWSRLFRQKNSAKLSHPVQRYAQLEGIWETPEYQIDFYGPLMRDHTGLPDCMALFETLCAPSDDNQSSSRVLERIRYYEKNIALRYHSAWIADRAMSFRGIEGRFPFLDSDVLFSLEQIATGDLPPKRSLKHFYWNHFKSKTLAKCAHRFPAHDVRTNSFSPVVLDWLDMAYQVYLDPALVTKHGLFSPEYINAALALTPQQRTLRVHQLLFMAAGVHTLLEHYRGV